MPTVVIVKKEKILRLSDWSPNIKELDDTITESSHDETVVRRACEPGHAGLRFGGNVSQAGLVLCVKETQLSCITRNRELAWTVGPVRHKARAWTVDLQQVTEAQPVFNKSSKTKDTWTWPELVMNSDWTDDSLIPLQTEQKR